MTDRGFGGNSTLRRFRRAIAKATGKQIYGFAVFRSLKFMRAAKDYGTQS
jgi:hypothetical protein